MVKERDLSHEKKLCIRCNKTFTFYEYYNQFITMELINLIELWVSVYLISYCYSCFDLEMGSKTIVFEDPIAQETIKQEIIEKLLDGNLGIATFLLRENYLGFLDEKEIQMIFLENNNKLRKNLETAIEENKLYLKYVFPILFNLTNKGDILAKQMFKKAVIRGYKNRKVSIGYLRRAERLKHNYFKLLEEDEIKLLIKEACLNGRLKDINSIINDDYFMDYRKYFIENLSFEKNSIIYENIEKMLNKNNNKDFIALPLLLELFHLGYSDAKTILKEEIIKRCERGNIEDITFLFSVDSVNYNNYFDIFDKDEMKALLFNSKLKFRQNLLNTFKILHDNQPINDFNNVNYHLISSSSWSLLKKLFDLGISEAGNILKSELIREIKNGRVYALKSLIDNNFLSIFNSQEINSFSLDSNSNFKEELAQIKNHPLIDGENPLTLLKKLIDAGIPKLENLYESYKRYYMLEN
ncbi:MAG: hypothetical protein ACFFAT_19675 [Promethearchaeota archaeon]